MSTTVPAPSRRIRPRIELLLVLGVSLGQSAVYSVVQLADDLTQGPLSGQSTTLNGRQDARAIFDFVYQILSIGFPLVPVLLALFLLADTFRAAVHHIGLDLRSPWRDARLGLVLAAAVGIPGIALYFGARALGLSVDVVTSGIGAEWYTIPVLVLSALRAALQEEVIMIGFFFEKLRELRWRPWAIITASALIRGSYHLYQGFGGFVGNAILGVVFGLLYQRFGRVAPLVIAHFILDFVSFVGVDLVNAIAPGLLPR